MGHDFLYYKIFGENPSSNSITGKRETCKPLTSKRDCETAARELGLPDTTATLVKSRKYPAHCSLFESKLYFNKNINSPKKCHRSRKKCICNDDTNESKFSFRYKMHHTKFSGYWNCKEWKYFLNFHRLSGDEWETLQGVHGLPRRKAYRRRDQPMVCVQRQRLH